MKRAGFWLLPVLVVTLGCASQPTGPKAEHPFDGKWKVEFYHAGTVTRPTGTFEFKQVGDSLQGSFYQQGKPPVTIERGLVKTDSLFFRLRTNLTADAPKYLYIIKGWRQKGSSNLEGTWWYTRAAGQWIASHL